MKKLTVTTLAITACLSTNVMAKNYSNNEYARVVSATPVYEQIEHRVPIQTCRNIDNRHSTPEHNHSSVVPVVVGGVIGGVVGHSIGSNRTNKQIGMIAGSVIGATIGANVDTGGQHRQREPDRLCSTTYQIEYEQVLIGYDVIYNYHDHRYYTYTKHHPGKKVRMPVEARPDRKHKKGRPDIIVMNPRHHDNRNDNRH